MTLQIVTKDGLGMSCWKFRIGTIGLLILAIAELMSMLSVNSEHYYEPRTLLRMEHYWKLLWNG